MTIAVDLGRKATKQTKQISVMADRSITKCDRPNKKISVFQVRGLKILGRVGTHVFFNFIFFSRKK